MTAFLLIVGCAVVLGIVWAWVDGDALTDLLGITDLWRDARGEDPGVSNPDA